MPAIFKTSDAKKASEEDLIESMNKISAILAERNINDVNFDADDMYRAMLSDNVFSNASNIREPFIATNSLIGIPGVPPRNNSSMSRMDGNHVIPIIELPGMDPYQAYIEDTETWIDSASISLNGPRQVHLHRVVPGMILSFHHYTTKGGQSQRVSINAMKIVYDSNNQIFCESVGEEYAMFNIPDENTVPRKKGF